LLIISQRPAKVDKNVLSQCNTQIIMRVTNPNDIRAITKSLEGISTELEEEIKRLPPGVAMLVSPDIPRAVMVQVRTRKSKHGGASKEISEDIEPEELDYEDEEEETARPSVSGSIFRKIFGRG
jgi:DNA helicase HerA-like ATPase